MKEYKRAKVTKVKARKNLKEAIIDAVDQLGGFDSFFKKGEKILLKPNFNTADLYPGSSDPEFLRAIVEILSDLGVGEMIIGDSCTFSQNTCKVIEKLGIFDFEKKYENLKVISFDKGRWIKKKVPGAKYLKKISLPEILGEVDKLLYLPCLKTHFIAKFTGSLKLSVGLMKPSERIPLHMRKVQEKIAEMNLVINPDLIIMDARTCFINGGPGNGDRRHPNLVLASESRLAIDIEGFKIIQSYEGNSLKDIKAEELPQIRRAIEIGIK